MKINEKKYNSLILKLISIMFVYFIVFDILIG